METKTSKQSYKAPVAKVVEVNLHNSILSGSDEAGAFTLDGYSEDTFTW